MKNKFDFKIQEKSEEKISLDAKILRLLARHGKMNFGDLASKTETEEKKSKLSYHLKTLQERGSIGKKGGSIYHFIPINKKIDEDILKILQLDNCGAQNIEQILENLKSNKKDYSLEEISKVLQDLDERWEITKTEGEMYSISVISLNKYGLCSACRKKFEDNQLIISMFTVDDGPDYQDFKIHAICRELLQGFDQKEQNCNYCGLNLNARLLNKLNDTGINIDSDIDKLFDDPFSKIFSVIDTDEYFSPVMWEMSDQYHPVGLACYKEKDGKKYHPYCMRIVEGQKS